MTDLGMTRRPDHSTSEAAAFVVQVKKVTLRERVIQLAHTMRSYGFTDDFLKIKHPDAPESSLRKRRTELAQENILLETGETRQNRHGQYEKVFIHRDYHPCPPPVIEREPQESKAGKIVRLEAQERLLIDFVALALPYVEDACEYDKELSLDGKERARVLARQMRKTVTQYKEACDVEGS